MSNQRIPDSLRAEAQPFSWTNLSGAQQKSANDIIAILDAIAERAEKAYPDRGSNPSKEHDFGFLPRIDPERENHVLLIDGARGSGKSALLLTLLNAWNRRLRRMAVEPQFDSPADAKGIVIPVGLIDLEALPKETNLRLNVVGQLQRIVQSLGPDDGADSEHHLDRGAWHTSFNDSPLKKAWLSFLSAATLGGADGLLQRRAHVDPEAFVVEMEETELHRMDIQNSFRSLIDALVTHFQKRRLLPDRRAPLFLIAVDDADMQPKLSIPLLHLVRELWHPRVVFLMTGDSELFEALLNSNVRRTLSKGWPPKEYSESKGPSLASDLVDQRLRKVIPPLQRYLLPPLPRAERCRFLEQKLRLVSAPHHPLKLQHFHEYIEFVEQAWDELPDNFREVRDLEQWIAYGIAELERKDHEQIGRRKSEPLDEQKPAARRGEDLVWAMTLHRLDYPREFDLLDKSVSSVSRELLAKQVAKLVGSKLRWTSTQDYTPLRTTNHDELPTNHVQTFFSSELLLVRTDIRGSWHADSTKHLLALDAIRYEPERVIDGIIEFLPDLPAIMQTKRANRTYAWPFPEWNSPLDVLVFRQFLRCVLDLPSGTQFEAGRLAQLYLLSVVEYAEVRNQRARGERVGKLQDILTILAKKVRETELPWAELANRIRAHAANVSSSTTPITEWAIRGACLLAAPEFDLGTIFANDWLKAIRTSFAGPLWARARHALNQTMILLREKRLQSSAETIADESMDVEIEEASGYEWDAIILEQGEADRAKVWKQFLAQTNELPVRPVEPHAGPLPASLSRYTQAARQTYLENNASLDVIGKWSKIAGAFGRGEGATREALRALWSETKREAPEMPDVPNNLTTAELLRLYKQICHRKNSWEFVVEPGELDVLPSVSTRRGAFRWADGVGLRHPLARIVFEIAWDFTVDTEDEALADGEETLDPRLRWWTGGGGRSSVVGGALYPWPAVGWWAFLDHILLAGAWNRRFLQMKRLNEMLSAPTPIGNDLALWYVRTTHQLAETRSARDDMENRWQTGAGKADWQNQIKRMRSHAPQHHGSARWRCYEKWLSRIPLLAAPESGLNTDVAEWILEAFAPGEAEKTTLREERTLRLTEGMDQGDEQAADTLARIDRDAGNHPWTRLFDPGS